MILDNKLKHFPANSPIVLRNETCIYCGVQLNDVSATKEHVIGRRFVPKGKLHGQWNLIVRACKDCNNKKSDLEDDVSAISMHADAWGRHSVPDDSLATEANRKGQNCVSRRTCKLVKDSTEGFDIRGTIAPGMEVTFNLSAPPQIESDRMHLLALMQMRAFFYFITYDHKSKRGGFWPGSFAPVHETIRSDWGNIINKAFMGAVVNWEPRFICETADGFFKAIIRRNHKTACWSWALEWNHKYRLIGFFGEKESIMNIVNTLPTLDVTTIAEKPDKFVSYRIER